MKLAIVAGEASGDLHAASVVRELRALDPSLRTFGIGGDLLAAEGMQLIQHARTMGIVGLFNVLLHLGMFRRIFATLVKRLEEERPDAVLLVDYPGFNLRLARKAKQLGLPVIYFISPQVWAWHRSRVQQIARYVDHMIVILPFEEEFYRRHGVPVTYVGHPLIEQTAAIARSGAMVGETIRLAVLPGSRRREVDDLLPPLLDAVRILQKERTVEPFIIQAPTIDGTQLQTIMQRAGVEVPVVSHDSGRALAEADIALCSSGTATLEAAVLGTPVIVVYKLGAITYQVARRLVKLPHVSLVNIIAGERVVPELLQAEVSGERIAAEVRSMLRPERYAEVRTLLDGVRRKLGEVGAGRRAAEAIMAAVR